MIRKIAAATALAIMLMASQAMAATHVWKSGASGNWSTAANWSAGGLPTSSESGGTIVQLPANSATTMDISGLVVDAIQFTGTGSSITGTTALGVNGANLTVNIDDPSGTNTISSPLSVSNAAEASVGTGEQLGISGTISGTGGLIKVGPGTLALTGTTANTYSGTTRVLAGVETLNQTAGVTIPGDVIIGNGTGSAGAATLRELQSSDLPSTANITVNSDGVFDLNGHTDSIKQLTVTGGLVSLGAGTLTTGGTLAMTGGSVTGASGSVLRLSADVTATSSSAAGATISAPIFLNGARTFTVSSGSHSPELAITGVLSNGSAPSSSLVKAGAGTLALTGPTANTYTGATNVQAGVLTLNQTLGVTIPGALTIGTGSGAAGTATVRELQSSDIASTSPVTVNADGVLDLNGHTDALSTLSVAGGTVLLASAGSGLTLLGGGTLSMTGGSIAGPSGILFLDNAAVNAASSPTSSATISANVDLAGTTAAALNPTFTVAAGSPPELVLSGVIAELSGSHGLIKAGAGTLRLTGTNTYTGTTTVSAGTLDADGQQSAPFAASSGGTLTGTGAIGPVTSPAR